MVYLEQILQPIHYLWYKSWIFKGEIMEHDPMVRKKKIASKKADTSILYKT